MTNEESSENDTDEQEQSWRNQISGLYGISDELTLPFVTILGYCDILDLSVDDGVERDCVRLIRKQTRTQLEYLRNYRQLRRIETGRFRVLNSVADPLELISDSLMIIQRDFDRYSPNSDIEHDETVRCQVMIDRFAARQIFTILHLYTIEQSCNQFKVRASLRIRPLPGELDRVHIDSRFALDGIGMSPEKVALFQSPIERSPVSTSYCFGGSDQALLLCRRLADLLGGSIRLTSEISQGFRFDVRIPCSIVKDEN